MNYEQRQVLGDLYLLLLALADMAEETAVKINELREVFQSVELPGMYADLSNATAVSIDELSERDEHIVQLLVMDKE